MQTIIISDSTYEKLLKIKEIQDFNFGYQREMDQIIYNISNHWLSWMGDLND